MAVRYGMVYLIKKIPSISYRNTRCKKQTYRKQTIETRYNIFSGNIYLFHAFDVGEISILKRSKLSTIKTVSLSLT
jgi:hypothetical protein